MFGKVFLVVIIVIRNIVAMEVSLVETKKKYRYIFFLDQSFFFTFMCISSAHLVHFYLPSVNV